MAGLSDLLSWIDSKKRTVGRNLSDLVNNPGDSFEMIDDRAKNYNQNVQPVAASGSLYNRPMTEEEIQQKNTDLAMSMMPMGVGHIAYHGSPHKFDKFKTEAIGTGEGAQAYGHGLYLAESPGVAQSYAEKLAQNATLKAADGTTVNFGSPPQRTMAHAAANRGSTTIEPWAELLQIHGGNVRKATNGAKKQLAEAMDSQARFPTSSGEFQVKHWTQMLDDLKIRGKGVEYDPGQYMYKTDIPDEAVARMLDWDKPLSQQAEVLAQLQKSKNKQIKAMLDFANKEYQSVPGEFPTAGEAFKLMSMNHTGRASADSAKASSLLAKQGIPGIRYLDGGSRSAGQGSSNFVAFDPEMIRILERNGQATGLQPWKPGEYRPLNDLMDVRKD